MPLDIGDAFAEGLARLTGGTAAVIVVAFVLVSLVSAVFTQTLQVEGLEALLEVVRASSPAQLDVSPAEYDRQGGTLERQLETTREHSPLAVELPASVAAAGLLAVALVAEGVSIVTVRAFATDEPDEVSLAGTTDRLGVATANGFVGGVVVWVLILAGSILLIVPGLFAAVVFYFLRQEIALEDRNFLDALGASWRLTKGHRVNVFALGLLVVVVTQAYRQLTEAVETTDEPADPYDAALGPDDIPE